MFKRVRSHSDTMLLALAVWLCTLPLALLIVAPLFGWQAASIAVFVLLSVVLIICWGVCSWKIFQDRSR